MWKQCKFEATSMIVQARRGYLEAAGSVQELYHVTNAGLAGLGKVRLQLLDHVQHQHLPGQCLEHNTISVLVGGRIIADIFFLSFS